VPAYTLLITSTVIVYSTNRQANSLNTLKPQMHVLVQVLGKIIPPQ
jgi:hypothetical protein